MIIAIRQILKITWKSIVLKTAAEVHAFEGSGHYAFWEESEEFNAALQRCREWQEAHAALQRRAAELEGLLLDADKRRVEAGKRAAEVRAWRAQPGLQEHLAPVLLRP